MVGEMRPADAHVEPVVVVDIFVQPGEIAVRRVGQVDGGIVVIRVVAVGCRSVIG
jgi:hypothetical protein